MPRVIRLTYTRPHASIKNTKTTSIQVKTLNLAQIKTEVPKIKSRNAVEARKIPS